LAEPVHPCFFLIKSILYALSMAGFWGFFRREKKVKGIRV